MAEFKLSPHALRPGDVVEIWHRGEFIGEITALDGPQINVVTKHEMTADIGKVRAVAPGGLDATVNMCLVDIKA